MRRVDRRTNASQTDRQTDQPMDTASYRGALSHLKRKETELTIYGGIKRKRNNETNNEINELVNEQGRKIKKDGQNNRRV